MFLILVAPRFNDSEATRSGASAIGLSLIWPPESIAPGNAPALEWKSDQPAEQAERW